MGDSDSLSLANSLKADSFVSTSSIETVSIPPSITPSFVNLSASRCYTIYNILWKDAKEIFWNLLHERYFEELEWGIAQAEEIESPAVHSFIAAVALYNHKQYLKRQKGVTVVEDAEVNRMYERKRRIKRIRRFFKMIKK